jgi:predicted deacylase
MSLLFGNITAVRGEVVRGFYDLIQHPTGHMEQLPVIIASGAHSGPTLLLTANIHGDEVTGIVVIHRLLEQLDLQTLKGTLVCIPSLNPSGNRNQSRYPQFDQTDPNRKWPDSNPEPKEIKDDNDWLDQFYEHEKVTAQETTWKKVFQELGQIKPDYHVDLHTFSILSIPFIFLDRVLYQEDKAEGEALFEKTQKMVDAMGLTVVIESPAKRYVRKKLHRSTSGTTLNKLRIPSCTIELGPMNAVDPYCRDAAIKSIKNLMRWAGIIDTPYQVITEVAIIKSKENYRYLSYPIAPETGIVDFNKNAGDFFGEGDVLAVIRSIDGNILTEIISEFDGFVIGWWNNIGCYKGNSLGMVGVADRQPMVISWKEINELNE